MNDAFPGLPKKSLPKGFQSTRHDKRHLIELRKIPSNSTASRGLGLFALRNIPRGTTIVSEVPLLEVADTADRTKAKDAFNRLSRDKKQAYLRLYGWIPAADAKLAKYGSMNNRTRKVMSVYCYNAFEKWVVELGSRFNHSCMPNVCVLTEQEDTPEQTTLRFYALRDILAGEELFVSYLGMSFLDRAERQRLLRRNWGFTCNCPACEDTDEGRVKEAQFVVMNALHHELQPLGKTWKVKEKTGYHQNRLVKLDEICELMESLGLFVPKIQD